MTIHLIKVPIYTLLILCKQYALIKKKCKQIYKIHKNPKAEQKTKRNQIHTTYHPKLKYHNPKLQEEESGNTNNHKIEHTLTRQGNHRETKFKKIQIYSLIYLIPILELQI